MRSTDVVSPQSNDRDIPDDNLLELAPCGSGLSPKLLRAHGGFLWWYVDLMTADGDGLVIIWSFGLPFLPGYASAARRGNAPPPSHRPSLNVSTYRDGALDFYLLQEFEPHQVQWDQSRRGDRWQFGRSQLESIAVDGQRRLKLDLALDVPQLEQRAHIQLEACGPGCRRRGRTHDPDIRSASALAEHDWAPLLSACQGRATLSIGDTDASLSGPIYHDRNGGKTPLHELGLQNWVWGRLPLPDREFIYYVLDGKDGSTQSLLLTVDSEGHIAVVPQATFHRGRPQKNLGGLTWWPTMEIRRQGQTWLTIEHCDVVDSGPFYMRTIPRVELDSGQVVRGLAEVCEPDRVDMAHHRPLVRMRVHHKQAQNSMWLPLFTGPKKGRISRLMRSLTTAWKTE